MPDRDPTIITSPLSRTVIREGITVDVQIYRLECDLQWALEVVNVNGTSSVWDELFDTEDEALAAFEEVVEQEGMETFLDDEDDIPTLH